mgnify:CR=1 FL=1
MKFIIEHLSKSFEKKEVLRDIDFSLRKENLWSFRTKWSGKDNVF